MPIRGKRVAVYGRGWPIRSFRSLATVMFVVAGLAGGVGYISSDKESREVSSENQLSASSAPTSEERSTAVAPTKRPIPAAEPSLEQRISELTARVEELTRQLEQLHQGQPPPTPTPSPELHPESELPGLPEPPPAPSPPQLPTLPTPSNIPPPLEVPTSLPVPPLPAVPGTSKAIGAKAIDPAKLATCTAGTRRSHGSPPLANGTFIGGQGADRQKSLDIIRRLTDWRGQTFARPAPGTPAVTYPPIDPEAAKAARDFICSELSKSVRELQALQGAR